MPACHMPPQPNFLYVKHNASANLNTHSPHSPQHRSSFHLSRSLEMRKTAMKIPIDTLPLELRVEIYEMAKLSVPSNARVVISNLGTEKFSSLVFWMTWRRYSQQPVKIRSKERKKKIMCELIAYTGNLSALQWARTEKAGNPDETCNKRMRITALPWNTKTCSDAAERILQDTTTLSVWNGSRRKRPLG